jgi:hypothetical protein
MRFSCVRLAARPSLYAPSVVALSPVVDPFESAWLKWAMAVTNGRVLADNVEVFASDQERKMHSRLATYYDPRRHCLVLVVVEAVDPFPVLWGVLLGEIAHGFRCCLDHVAWALYKRGRTPNLSERRERAVSFPIYGTREGFNKALDSKLPGVRRADRAIVRRYQPYRPGESRAHRHVFTVLQELSNEDKHRAIQRVVPIASQVHFTKFEAIDCIVRRGTRGGTGGRLEPGAELMRLYVKKTGPNPRIDGQPHFTLTPALHELLGLEEFLDMTMNATSLLLREFAEPPPSAVALLGAPVPPKPGGADPPLPGH